MVVRSARRRVAICGNALLQIATQSTRLDSIRRPEDDARPETRLEDVNAVSSSTLFDTDASPSRETRNRSFIHSFDSFVLKR